MPIRDRAYSFLKRRTRIRRPVVSLVEAWRGRGAGSTPLPRITIPEQIDNSSTRVLERSAWPPERIDTAPTDQIPQEWRKQFAAFAAAGVPPASAYRLSDGRVLGIHGAPATASGSLVADLAWGPHQVVRQGSREELDSAAAAGFTQKARRLQGSAALLSTSWGRGYFHWLWDVLPRVSILNAAEVRLSDMNHVIVPAYISNFHIETLAALGVKRDQVVTSLSNRHLLVDELWVPSLVRGTGPVPSWACDFLRRFLVPEVPRSAPKSDRLFITRKATDHGFSPNEQALVDRVRETGFETVALEDFTLAEKMSLLSRSQALMGVSGAGLANMVFCKPGTAIIEIQVTDEPDPVLWDMAHRCGHIYRAVPFSNGTPSEAKLGTVLAELF